MFMIFLIFLDLCNKGLNNSQTFFRGALTELRRFSEPFPFLQLLGTAEKVLEEKKGDLVFISVSMYVCMYVCM